MSVGLFLALGVCFGLLASLMSFLITHQEYSKHMRDTKKARWSAVRTAAVTFVFFLVLALLAGLVLARILGSSP